MKRELIFWSWYLPLSTALWVLRRANGFGLVATFCIALPIYVALCWCFDPRGRK